MPTFVFFRSKAKIDEFCGAKLDGLKSKLEKWLNTDGDQSDDKLKGGYVSQIQKRNKTN